MSLPVHVIRCAGPPTVIPPGIGVHWIDTLNRNLYESVGTASLNDWILLNQNDVIITETITASSSFDLDIIPLATLCVVKYVICVFSSAENKWKSFELLGSKKTTTFVEDSLYAVTGAILNVDFDFSVDGTDAKLIGTNNEVFDVNVRILKHVL